MNADFVRLLGRMPSLEQQVGAMVRYHRERADLTQGALAERVELQVGSVSRIERGENAPSFETLDKLASALDVEVRDFFGAGDFSVKEGRSDPLVSIVLRISQLSAEDAAWADQLLELALKGR